MYVHVCTNFQQNLRWSSGDHFFILGHLTWNDPGGYYLSTRRLWSAVCDKVFECTEHSDDRNSSSGVPGPWSHTARRSTHLLQEFCWEVYNHQLPCRPDLALSDVHLFLHRNKFLSSQRQRFQNDRDAEMSVTVVPISGGRLLRHRIRTFVPQYDKCLNPDVNMLENS